MASRFFDIAFTPNVKAMQSQMGSRENYSDHEQVPAPATATALRSNEIAFIEARDSFYQSTVSETGWPYVQHRGGPAGFLKVLDAHTIGYADFTGNRQYISTGNLVGDDRVCLFLMDYAHQARLKIFGRARVINEDSDPELLARLDNPNYRARVERGIVIHIEGFDWNCPKYITPRYTKDEIAQRIKEARTTQETQTAEPPEEATGTGELALMVTGIRQLTPRIRAYELHAEDWGYLPPTKAGAHLEVPVRLADGTVVTRQYSLVMHPDRHDLYEIAVLCESDGRGGSRAIHASWRIGTQLRVTPPINHLPLHNDARPAVLIAGGIGITPIKAMAQALRSRNAIFELHYTGRTPVDMAYRDQLAVEFTNGYFTYFSRVPNQPRLDVVKVLQGAASDAVFYVCGPVALIEAVRAAANRLGIASEQVQHESFY
jgi:ferredoxin-NADP reductase/predicted pyridoxine 5'-phosphate oxidase superfamily flavin-nucleotide-binding protein